MRLLLTTLMIPISCLFGALLAAAQVPQLGTSFARRPDGKGFEITLQNSYVMPATAYVIVSTFTGAAGDGRTFHAARWINAIPADPGNQPIPANGAVHFPLWTNASSLLSVSSLAVIYANGDTVGNKNVIQAMLAERKQIAADLQTTIPLLKAAAGNPSLSTFRTLSRQLLQNAVSHERQLVTVKPQVDDWKPSEHDRVCRMLAYWLRNEERFPPSTWSPALLREAAFEQQELVEIQASQPHP